MNFKWVYDPVASSAVRTEWNLVTDDENETIIAFVTHLKSTNEYICRFMRMMDDEYPDGKRYKTRKSAMAWCRKHAPVMYIAHHTGGSDET